jgi:hypothetical protein
MRAITATLVPLVLLGCSAPTLAPRYHPFEHRLHVAVDSIPHLTEGEWTEIRKKVDARAGYTFEYGIRERYDLLRVDLIRDWPREPKTGISVFFELKGGVWVENPRLEVELAILPPFHSSKHGDSDGR